MLMYCLTPARIVGYYKCTHACTHTNTHLSMACISLTRDIILFSLTPKLYRIVSVTATAIATPETASTFICPSQTPSFITVTVNVTINETVNYTVPSSVYVTQNVTQSVTLTQNVTQTATLTQNVTQLVTTIVPSFVSVYVTEWMTVNHTIVNNVTHVNTVINIQEIEQVAEEIVKNLTVDTKTTSSYLRSKTSAHDPRESAKYMGLLGTLLVVVPMGVILLMDVRRIITDIRTYENIFRSD